MADLKVYCMSTKLRLYLIGALGADFPLDGELFGVVRAGAVREIEVTKKSSSEFELVFPKLPVGYGIYELYTIIDSEVNILARGSLEVRDTLVPNQLVDDVFIITEGTQVNVVTGQGMRGKEGPQGSITPELQELADICEDNLRDSLAAAQNAAAASQAAGVHEAGALEHRQASAASADEVASRVEEAEVSAQAAQGAAQQAQDTANYTQQLYDDVTYYSQQAQAAASTAAYYAQLAQDAANSSGGGGSDPNKLDNFGEPLFIGTGIRMPNVIPAFDVGGTPESTFFKGGFYPVFKYQTVGNIVDLPYWGLKFKEHGAGIMTGPQNETSMVGDKCGIAVHLSTNLYGGRANNVGVVIYDFLSTSANTLMPAFRLQYSKIVAGTYNTTTKTFTQTSELYANASPTTPIYYDRVIVWLDKTTRKMNVKVSNSGGMLHCSFDVTQTWSRGWGVCIDSPADMNDHVSVSRIFTIEM